MTIELPTQDNDTVAKSARAIEKFERDRRRREAARRNLSREMRKPAFGPGMFR